MLGAFGSENFRGTLLVQRIAEAEQIADRNRLHPLGFEPAGGGYADYVRVMSFVLPGVVRIPARNSFLEGAMLEPVNTVLKAIHRLSLLRGDLVWVIGQGPVGLMFTRLLALRGISVVASDLLAARLTLAGKLGARWTFRGRHAAPSVETKETALTQAYGRLLRGMVRRPFVAVAVTCVLAALSVWSFFSVGTPEYWNQ